MCDQNISSMASFRQWPSHLFLVNFRLFGTSNLRLFVTTCIVHYHGCTSFTSTSFRLHNSACAGTVAARTGACIDTAGERRAAVAGGVVGGAARSSPLWPSSSASVRVASSWWASPAGHSTNRRSCSSKNGRSPYGSGGRCTPLSSRPDTRALLAAPGLVR